MIKNRMQENAIPCTSISDSTRSPTSDCYSARKRHLTTNRGGGEPEYTVYLLLIIWHFDHPGLHNNIFIRLIAIAYSMGQIIKSVCVCQSVSVSVCVCPSASTLTVAFLDRFSPKLART